LNKQAISCNKPSIIDNEFIEQHCQNFEKFIEIVEQTDWSFIQKQSGLTKEQLLEVAQIYIQAESVICTWAMGITQHKHSVATIQEIVNLQLLRGNIGKKGAGLCPVRGHSNVQGNRTVGINEKPAAQFVDAMSKLAKQSLPYKKGHNVYHALTALLNKQSRVIVSLGGNIASASPDTQQTIQALENSKLNVQISTKLNRSHLCIGEDALILPCLGRTEIDNQNGSAQFITVEDTFSMVHASQGNVTPLSLLQKSEVEIIANIAHSTIGSKNVNWLELAQDYNKIREMIAASIEGFESFNDKLDVPGGFYLGNSATERKWHNTENKALFSSTPLPEKLVAELQNNDNSVKNSIFTLQTLRSHDQYNTTIYGMNDRYRGISNERNIVFINKKDAAYLKLIQDDKVDITSIWPDNIQRTVKGFSIKIYDIPQGNLAAYYPETNPLVPLNSVGDRSYTPTSKAIAVIINKSVINRIL